MPHSLEHVPAVTLDEILSQPAVWRAALARLDSSRERIAGYLSDAPGADVVLTGCGTSYYLPLTAASLYTSCTRSEARGVPASEILTYPDGTFPAARQCLLVAISRSGKTPETIAAARYVQQHLAGRTLAITCAAGTPLFDLCDHAVVIPEGSEQTRFMTRSFSSMLLAWQYLLALRTGDENLLDALRALPARAEEVIRRWEPFLKELASGPDFRQYIYLGQGPYYGLACESMLKIKEMACTPAEAYHSMEFMHGPRHAADGRTLMTVLLSDCARAQELELLPKLRKLGTSICVLCAENSPEIAQSADYVIEVGPGLSDFARLLLYMPVTQLYGYYRALATAS